MTDYEVVAVLDYKFFLDYSLSFIILRKNLLAVFTDLVDDFQTAFSWNADAFSYGQHIFYGWSPVSVD